MHPDVAVDEKTGRLILTIGFGLVANFGYERSAGRPVVFGGRPTC